jgi:DnaJ-class molecular chaperone
MALKWHPDKNPDQQEKAQAMFLKIYQAYEFLKDKSARMEYDEQIAAKKRRTEFEEERQATSSAQRKAHLTKLQEVTKTDIIVFKWMCHDHHPSIVLLY